MINISKEIEHLIKAKYTTEHKNIECTSSIMFYWTFKSKFKLLEICTSDMPITYYIKKNHQFSLS